MPLSVSTKPLVLTINGGSSSVKFALYEAAESPQLIVVGGIDRIGQSKATFWASSTTLPENFSHDVEASDHSRAAALLLEWIGQSHWCQALTAIGHRIVHGGAAYCEPQLITAAMLDELRRLVPFDPEHLPEEIRLVEAIRQRFPDLPQVACFDTAFHHDLPRVARLLAIPRRYEALGVRRYGFHGISYAFLMEELTRLGDPAAMTGRIILAHLGSGASLAAVRYGKSIDTSMGFTPAAGVPMSTRSGDIDPGLAGYLARTEGMTPAQFSTMVTTQSGLLGISETSADMHDLLEQESSDVRAAEAVSLFCYQICKCIGAYAAALGGIDTLVFTGGIGENAPGIRERICTNLGFLGIYLDRTQNTQNAALISTHAGPVCVRVIRTDEEIMIAKSVARLLPLDPCGKPHS